jgi:hypothetical protein
MDIGAPVKPSSSLPSLLLTCVLALMATTPLQAQRMTKGIEYVRPRFGQQGTTVEVQLLGISQALKNPREVIFFQPGIRAHDLKPGPKPRRIGFAHGGYIDASVSCKFEIAPDCPPGQFPFRLLTATELSVIGTFHVTPFRVISETKKPNDRLDAAMPIENAVTVLGELGADGVDLYRVPVDKGRRLSLELDAVRIADQNYGDSQFDLALRVLDANGRELAHNDDNAFHIQDPVISMVAREKGEVFVEVKHSVYSTREIVYALHVGDNRRPTVAYPMGGMAGSKQTFQMIGDAKGTYRETLRVPERSTSKSGNGTFHHFGNMIADNRGNSWMLNVESSKLDVRASAPSAIPLRSSEFPNAFESEPIAKLPVALNGIIESPTDVDSFRVTVKEGEAWRVRVFAASLGSPIDPRLVIRPLGKDGKPGDPEVEKDDAKLSERDIFGARYRGGGGRREVLDPSVVWRPKQTGDYQIEITDSSGAGGPTGVYRVEIEEPPTRFQTLLKSRSNDWVESMRFSGLAVPRGGRWTINITLQDGQFENLKGDFDIIARGLPKGVRLISPRVKPGTKLWPVQLVAESNAPLGGSVFTLEARPVETGQSFTSHSQQNVPFINHSGGNSLHYVQVDRYIAAVTDPAPFTIEVDAPSTPIVRNSEAGIPIRIRRRDGFKGEVQFAVGFVGSGISSQPITTIPANESSAILKLSVGGSAGKGKQPFVVIANNVPETLTPWLGTGHIHVSSDIVTLEVADPYLQLFAQPTSIRRGEQKTFVWKVRQLTPFEGEATARLLGLPTGLSIVKPLPTLSSTSKEVTFRLQATHEALLGRVTGLNCEVVINSNGAEIVQRAGRGNLRVDPAALPNVQR